MHIHTYICVVPAAKFVLVLKQISRHFVFHAQGIPRGFHPIYVCMHMYMYAHVCICICIHVCIS